MLLQTQIVETKIRVAAPDQAFAAAVSRYLNTAVHHVPPSSDIEVAVRLEGQFYVLPSGRRELSSEIAAEAAWEAVEQTLRGTIAGWLNVWGLCVDIGSRRMLILGDDWTVLRALALHTLADGITVSSATGVCVRDGVALPYAGPFEVSENDVSWFQAATGKTVQGRQWRDEMGRLRTRLAPPDFGLSWSIDPRPVDDMLVLQWNPGGWPGLGGTCHPSVALDYIAAAAFLPAELSAPAKLAFIGEMRALAAWAPMRQLHLGRLWDLAPILREHAAAMTARG